MTKEVILLLLSSFFWEDEIKDMDYEARNVLIHIEDLPIPCEVSINPKQQVLIFFDVKFRNLLTKPEQRAIILHELGHQKYGDDQFKADRFAVERGHRLELISALKKLSSFYPQGKKELSKRIRLLRFRYS